MEGSTARKKGVTRSVPFMCYPNKRFMGPQQKQLSVAVMLAFGVLLDQFKI